MKCFWNKDGVCKHPKISGTPATEETCRQCAYFSRASQQSTQDPETYEAMLRKRAEWEADGRHKAEEERQKAMSLLNKAASWAKAEVSQVVHGPVDDETYRMRLETCNACFRLERAAGAELGFCKACGCGQSARAELTVKGRMPEAKCPIQAWGDPAAPRAPLPDTLGR
jgi:hypothetical protein